ncbi:MAG: efflux RND transporter periplasmic adaptor subunit [Bacteroidota bacterium]|nr:efflux RND transporter periplasmic adaptor subunit [Bacteroidota bacterium]
MNKTLKISLIAVAIIVIGLCVWLFLLKKTNPASLSVQTSTVTTGDILTTVTATGTVEPLVTVEVGTQVSGIINKVYVDYSSVVKKGQLLAELDKSTLKASFVSSKASYEAEKNELTYQQSNFNRVNQLYKSQSVSRTDYETALYQYNNARFSFTKAQQELEKAQTNLGYANIYSPIDGVVLSRAVDEGQTVAASFSTPTMFTIAKDLKQMRVIANVDEADIGSVKVGQNVMFTVDAFPNDEFKGTVTKVRLEAKTNSNVVTYEVVINAPNPDLKLLPGLTASVNIYTNERRGVLVMPAKAQRVQPTADILAKLNIPVKGKIATSKSAGQTSTAKSTSTGKKTLNSDLQVQTYGPDAPEGELNQRTIWIQNTDGSLSQRKVTIGITDGVSTEILDGLKAGDKVVTELASTTNIASSDTSSSQENSSPFMPKRPDQKTSKK